MNEKTKIQWLKQVLLFNIAVAVLVWGLPLWLGPRTVLTALKITTAGDLFYLRMFGALQLALAYLQWLAYQNPSGNSAIIRFNIAENGIALLTVVAYQLAFGIKDQYVWISALLFLLFGGVYYLLRPSE